MECPNCKKQLADNAKSCPECGYDFTEQINKKNTTIGCVATLVVVLFISLMVGGCVNWLFSDTDSSSQEQSAEKWTQEDIKEADDFIITMEATGLVKERKDTCSDGSKGCYYFLIDENLWTNSTTYEVKQQLLTASEIYASSQNPYKFFKGIGYMSGKTMYDIWGIK